MQQKEKSTADNLCSPDNKEQPPSKAPVSENIPNAHAVGDGATGRDKDSIMEADTGSPENRQEEDGEKEPGPY